MKSLPVLTKILPKLSDSDTLWIACSGGIDSMFAAMYFERTRNVGLAYYNHGTEYADRAEEHVAKYAAKYGLPYVRDQLKTPPPQGVSLEAYWREQRYEFLDGLGPAVVTAHHLDDAVETWIWGMANGTPRLPKLVRGNVYRPFLACRKEAMLEQLKKNQVSWIEDPSNTNTDYTRNLIRHSVMPEIVKVNPGIHTVIQRKIQERATLELIKA
jgi:tRNA(Ile)-lysidine synthase